MYKKDKLSGPSRPFITTSFPKNFQIYLMLWPVWWLLGIEQLLLPVFIFWEIFRYLVLTQGRFKINTPLVFALLIALWWAIPVLWIPRIDMDRFLKNLVTIWTQFCTLFLLWNTVRVKRDWDYVLTGLNFLAVYVAVSGLIFITGIWRGNFTSAIGHLIPTLIASSSFFESIAIRNFGSTQIDSALFNYRTSGLALGYGGLGSAVVLLTPFVFWFLRLAQTKRKFFFQSLILISLAVSLLHTEARTAYIAMFGGVVLVIVLRLKLLHKQNTFLTFTVLLSLVFCLVLLLFIAKPRMSDLFETSFIEWRSGSWNVRMDIYRETLRLLPKHLFVGWGQSVRIPFLKSVFSAGSHSGYLGILFQHGIIGLLLYFGFWITIWRRLFEGLRVKWQTFESSYFWVIAAMATFAFNIHEIATNWWWDQLVAIIIWTVWGLILVAHRILRAEDAKLDSTTTNSV